MGERAKLLRAEAARAFVEQLADQVTKALVEIPYREVLRRFAASDGLLKDNFDICFFVEGLFLSASCHERIRHCLNGVDHRWFSEDDDEIRQASVCPLPAAPSLAPGFQPARFAAAPFFRRQEGNWLLHSYEDRLTMDLLFCTEVLPDFATPLNRLRPILSQ